jgi:uncharacterized protein Usg
MSLALQLKDYRLTTARIYYHLPDYPAVLQSYVWQEFDRAPEYPELHKFLEFWRGKIEGRLHSVMVGSTQLVKPAGWRHVKTSLMLN